MYLAPWGLQGVEPLPPGEPAPCPIGYVLVDGAGCLPASCPSSYRMKDYGTPKQRCVKGLGPLAGAALGAAATALGATIIAMVLQRAKK